MLHGSRILLGSVLLTGLLFSVGCGNHAFKQKERQMQLVARDWAMTIRASQVVPVYPLTQDIQPGDVFLVNQTVAEQSKRFRDRGFMPTDLLVTRLESLDYSTFYSMRGSGESADPCDHENKELVLPRDWRDAPKPKASWERFPRAGFPSYTFEVSNSGGLSVAIPVQAVPVALSVTGAAKATGSMTISDASTYGLDASAIYNKLKEASRFGKLDSARPPVGQGPWYLRVITRIFAAKSFDIVITARDTFGGGADVGAAQPISDPAAQLERGMTIDYINDQIKASESASLDANGIPLPGGSVRATFTNGRTIGFTESFAEPIAIGYHGFDVAIDSDGNLGAIIPTFQVLDEAVKPTPPTAVSTEDSAYMALLNLLEQLPTATSLQILKMAARNSGRFQSLYTREVESRPKEPVSSWVSVTSGNADVHLLTGWVSRAIRESGD